MSLPRQLGPLYERSGAEVQRSAMKINWRLPTLRHRRMGGPGLSKVFELMHGQLWSMKGHGRGIRLPGIGVLGFVHRKGGGCSLRRLFFGRGWLHFRWRSDLVQGCGNVTDLRCFWNVIVWRSFRWKSSHHSDLHLWQSSVSKQRDWCRDCQKDFRWLEVMDLI
jgi:hypothetical protein